jgi:hypothetical protein
VAALFLFVHALRTVDHEPVTAGINGVNLPGGFAAKVLYAAGRVLYRGIKNGFPLEKRMETNRPIHEDYALVKHFRNEQRAKMGPNRGEFAPQMGEKRG